MCAASYTGSSPLARGTPDDGRRQRVRVRFIPARAGNTRLWPARRRSSAVHPRSRGEHPATHTCLNASTGSSPLARGTPRRRPVHRGRHRFIPARAGNTSFEGAPSCFEAVHPRSRGEHWYDDTLGGVLPGSSPLARGTPARGGGVQARVRFIPARAGNTASISSATSPRAVHPRSRGEHLTAIPRGRPPVGSSPLARGTPAHHVDDGGAGRFIPARAGNTGWRVGRLPCRPVHPRSRGEHLTRTPPVVLPLGSSPLARGTRLQASARHRRFRFIPARAGNTSKGSRGSTGRSVHPRSRGEHPTGIKHHLIIAGSSPLARGTRARARGTLPQGAVHPRSRGEHAQAVYADVVRIWFIPARAGNTRRALREARA